MRAWERTADARDVLTAISDGMVALLKDFYGRGGQFILGPSDLVEEHEMHDASRGPTLSA